MFQLDTDSFGLTEASVLRQHVEKSKESPDETEAVSCRTFESFFNCFLYYDLRGVTLKEISFTIEIKLKLGLK